MKRFLFLLSLLFLLVNPAWGADAYHCIKPPGYTLDVDEDARYTNEYTSMSAAEADLNGTVATGDILYIDILHGSGTKTWDPAGDNGPDTSGVEWEGWDCQGTGKVVVRTLTSAQAANGISSRPDWSDGAWDSTEYVLQVDSTTAIELDNDHDVGNKELSVDFIGIQVEVITAADDVIDVKVGADHGTVQLIKCWIRQSGGDEDGVICGDNSGVVLNLINCVIDGAGGTGDDGVYSSGNGTVNVYNCDIFGWNNIGVRRLDGTCNIVNCINGDNNNDWDGTLGGQYNCSDDGDGPGTNVSPKNGADDWTGDLTTPWTDITVKDTDANIYHGSPISQADDSLVPSDDVLGNPRNTGVGQDVCIGAFEYAAAPTDTYSGRGIGRGIARGIMR